MLLLGFWVLAAAQSPGTSSSSQLVLGLAAVAAAMLVVLAAAVLAVPAPLPAAAGPARGVRARVRRLPRLLDPDAAGRPRPRAPTACPAVLLPRPH
jgi:hypothetical protein